MSKKIESIEDNLTKSNIDLLLYPLKNKSNLNSNDKSGCFNEEISNLFISFIKSNSLKKMDFEKQKKVMDQFERIYSEYKNGILKNFLNF